MRENLFAPPPDSPPEPAGPAPRAPVRAEGDASFVSVPRVIATVGILIAIMGLVFVLVWALELTGTPTR
ncbi:hypothetical protein FB566_1379 [Stackebrandtia endophytica]|uniref:Uncharacterized protein n=2 Tax=Stackebrandtia endophytica TaxID=1496996 RepID=A0A543ATF1_9ACTN|nr:hypothetical protein FB566_1379 [Stackebrandtia endophytica]